MNSKNAMCYFTQNNDVELLLNAKENFSMIFEDIRSFSLNYEINALIYNNEFAIKCRDGATSGKSTSTGRSPKRPRRHHRKHSEEAQGVF